MQRKNIKSTLEKISSGNFTPEEETIARYWIHQLHQKTDARFSDEDLERIGEEMWQGLEEKAQVVPVKMTRLWTGIVAIAAAVALIVLGMYFFNYSDMTSDSNSQLAVQDIAAGKMGATLTLSNGKKIRLSEAVNGKLADESGVIVTKSADGQLEYAIKGSEPYRDKINTLTTAKGETYRVRLPDGSLVFLNAASSLTYSTSLIEQGKRVVRLVGEGYFEVQKDKAHPFIVKTDHQVVEVLGTHFNINAYRDEQYTKTTLLEGSVKVSGAKEVKVLAPGQQSSLNGGNIIVVQADLEEAVSWKNGEIIFNGQDVHTVMRMISRWYDVDVVYEGPIPSELYYAKVSRFAHIGKLLRLLEKTQIVHFKIEGRKVIVTK